MRLLIGIDDTDNQHTRGTGYRARQLGALLEENGLAKVEGITRHQLLLDPRVPYTSHNSSACLVANIKNQAGQNAVADYCRNFLLQASAPGADAGLCVASWTEVGPAVQQFGYQAKAVVLTRKMALNLARQENILLEGLTGDYSGVIGALAAIGLRAGGQDGRFIWLHGLRELSGIYTAEQLLQMHQIDRIVSLDNTLVPLESRIDVGEWRRPILRDGQATLLVEQVIGQESFEWRVAPKEIVKQY